MVDTNNLFGDFFSSLLQNVDVNILGSSPFVPLASEKLYDCAKAECAYKENPSAFLREYQNAADSFLAKIGEEDGFQIVQHSLVLLKLVDINASFKLDSAALAHLLQALSTKVQLLQTTYLNQKYGDMWGFGIAHMVEMKVHSILEGDSAKTEAEESQRFILDVVSKIPITNTTLAEWNGFALKYYKKSVDKKVSQVIKVLSLYDSLVGSGLHDLFICSTEEKMAKKVKPFDDVGLRDISSKILAFYSCKTGNAKKRFLSCGIEDFIEYPDLINGLNLFLTNG